MAEQKTSYQIQRAEQSKFDNLLYSAMEVLDDISESNIRDADYKKMCDILMELKNTTIYTSVEKRVKKNRPTKIHSSLAEKMENKKYIFCPKCDRPVLSTKKALSSHQKLDICINVNQCKITAVVTGKKTQTGTFKFNAKYSKIALVLNNKLSRRFIPNGVETKNELTKIHNPIADTYSYNYKCIRSGVGSDIINNIVHRKYSTPEAYSHDHRIAVSLDDILSSDEIIPTTRIIKIKRRKIAKREIVLEH